VFLKNGNQKKCKGKKIYVQINGFKKDSGKEKVTCEVGKIEVVKKGKTVEWSSIKHNLGNCSNVLFDVSVGKEPTVQVKTDKGLDYCPKSVELKINDIYFCWLMKSDNNEGKYKKEQNSKIHDTFRGQCT
jgi:hypothetical protein